jgi:hypothetical protein
MPAGGNFLYKNSEMASFCGSEPTSFTDADLQADYGASTQPGVLVSANLANATRSTEGLVAQDALNAAVTSLMGRGIVPKPPSVDSTSGIDNAAVQLYAQKEAAFLNALRLEYCFYEARYKYAVRQLIQQLQNGYSDTNSANQALIQKFLGFSQTLNRKLNDLSQLTNTITQVRNQQTQASSAGIDSLNRQITERTKKIEEQNAVLSGGDGQAKLYKEMMKYTKERVDYTNNMLTMYAFMNVTALGLLVYLYSAMKE